MSLALYSSVIGRFFVSKTAAVLTFLTVLALTPRYIGIGVGSGGFALSAQRMIALSLLALCLMVLFTKEQKTYPQHWTPRYYVRVMVGLYLVSAFASFLNGGGDLYFVFPFIEDLTYLGLSYFLVFYIYPMNRSGVRFLLFLFLVPVGISAGIAAIEMIRSAPILAGLENNAILAYRDFAEAKFRDGGYRAKALFDGPLIFSEFAVYSLVAVAYLWGVKEWRGNGPKPAVAPRLLILGGVLAVFCVLATGSRAGLALTILTLICFWLILETRAMGRKSTRLMVGGYIAVGLGMVLALLVMTLSDIDPRRIVAFHEISDQFERSNYARFLQYVLVFDIMRDSPIIGFGYQRNFAVNFEALFTLDNHYLRILLQSGIIGLALFAIALVTVVRTGFGMLVSTDRAIIRLGAYLIVFIIIFMLQKPFLSQPNNNIYLHLVYFLTIREANKLYAWREAAKRRRWHVTASN